MRSLCDEETRKVKWATRNLKKRTKHKKKERDVVLRGLVFFCSFPLVKKETAPS